MMRTLTTEQIKINGQLPKASEPIALTLSLNSVWHMSYNQFNDKKGGGLS